MKILSKLHTQCYALKQITGVDEKQNALKDVRILTSSARGHILNTAVWMCVIVAFLYALGSSLGFGRIHPRVTR